MISLVVVTVGLVPFFWHQFAGHHLHLRALRILRPSTLVPVTAHERRHAQKSRPEQAAIDLAWVAYVTVVAMIAVIAGA